MTSNAKIRPEHLARPAIIYVRPSTLDQVRHHQESRRRQYDLAAHARALGWHEVIVIDEDLGKHRDERRGGDRRHDHRPALDGA